MHQEDESLGIMTRFWKRTDIPLASIQLFSWLFAMLGWESGQYTNMSVNKLALMFEVTDSQMRSRLKPLESLRLVEKVYIKPGEFDLLVFLPFSDKTVTPMKPTTLFDCLDNRNENENENENGRETDHFADADEMIETDVSRRDAEDAEIFKSMENPSADSASLREIQKPPGIPAPSPEMQALLEIQRQARICHGLDPETGKRMVKRRKGGVVRSAESGNLFASVVPEPPPPKPLIPKRFPEPDNISNISNDQLNINNINIQIESIEPFPKCRKKVFDAVKEIAPAETQRWLPLMCSAIVAEAGTAVGVSQDVTQGKFLAWVNYALQGVDPVRSLQGILKNNLGEDTVTRYRERAKRFYHRMKKAGTT